MRTTHQQKRTTAWLIFAGLGAIIAVIAYLFNTKNGQRYYHQATNTLDERREWAQKKVADAQDLVKDKAADAQDLIKDKTADAQDLIKDKTDNANGTAGEEVIDEDGPRHAK